MNIVVPSSSRDTVSVILFGSCARGDSDAQSDCDICAFTRDVDYLSVLRVREVLARANNTDIMSIAVYPQQVVKAMAARGSLFLWHLRLEGLVVFDPRGFAAHVLEMLSVFTGYSAELHLFECLVNDVEMSLRGDGLLTEVDLHVLQAVVRDTCIILSYYGGQPEFGRAQAFDRAAALWPGMPVSSEIYSELCMWHLQYARGAMCAEHLPTERRGWLFVNSVKALLRFALDLLP